MSRPLIRANAAVLGSLGLSANEILVYQQMLDRPQGTVRELSTRIPLPRTLLYYVLGQLVHRGLVSTKDVRGRATYTAEDPERIYDLLSHREHEVKKESDAIRVLVPALKRRYRFAGKRTSVRTFEGIEEYRRALDGIIISGSREVFAYEMISEKRPAVEVRDAHERRRIARKIQKDVLFFESAPALRRIRNRAYDDFTEFRAVKEGSVTPFETDFMMYDGKLLYTSYDTYEPMAVLIEDESLYTMQKNLFDALWKQATDYTLLPFFSKKA